MSGRSRLPGGQQRRASQRHSRPAAPAPIAVVLMPNWVPGDRVRWKDYTGQFLRDTVDGQVEVLIGGTAARLGVRDRKRYFRACIPAEVEATWPGS